MNKIISSSADGNFDGSRYKLATTNVVEYYPAYITFELRRQGNYAWNDEQNQPHNKLCEVISNDVYLYRKPERLTSSSFMRHTYNDLFNALRDKIKSVKYLFTFNDESHQLTVLKGYIADENDNVLLILTTNKFVLFGRDNQLLTNNLRLYVSTELLTNEKYKNFYKRLEKDYISEFYKNNIEVVFTTSKKIDNAVFKNNFNIEFDSLSQLSHILETEPIEISDYEFYEDDYDVPNNTDRSFEEVDLPF